MGADDDSQPPRRPRSHWGDDERAAIGRERRVAPPRGVPIDPLAELADATGNEPGRDDGGDFTAPVALLERSTPKNQQFTDDLLAAQERYERDPAFRALWNEQRRQRHDSSSSLKKIGDRAIAAASPLPQESLATIETRLKLLYKILGALAVLVLGSVITIAKGVYDRGHADGALEQRTQELERRVEFLEHVITPDHVIRSLFGGTNP